VLCGIDDTLTAAGAGSPLPRMPRWNACQGRLFQPAQYFETQSFLLEPA